MWENYQWNEHRKGFSIKGSVGVLHFSSPLKKPFGRQFTCYASGCQQPLKTGRNPHWPHQPNIHYNFLNFHSHPNLYLDKYQHQVNADHVSYTTDSSGVLRNKRYSSEIHINPISRESSFTYNLFSSYPIVMDEISVQDKFQTGILFCTAAQLPAINLGLCVIPDNVALPTVKPVI